MRKLQGNRRQKSKWHQITKQFATRWQTIILSQYLFFSYFFVLHHPVSWPPSPHRFFTLVLVGFISWCVLCNSNLLVLLSLLTLQQLTKLHQLAMQQTPFTPLGQTTPAFPGTYPRGPLDNSFSLHPEKHFFSFPTFHLISLLAQHDLAPVVSLLLWFSHVYIFLSALSDITPVERKKKKVTGLQL